MRLHGKEARALFGRRGARIAPGAGDRRAFGERVEPGEARRHFYRGGSLLHCLIQLVRLHDIAGDAAPDSQFAAATSDRFFEALDDDLNISAALAEVFDQVRETNSAVDRNELAPGQAAALLIWWQRINQVLQLQDEGASIPENVSALLEKRTEARAAKKWSESDALRAEIESLGWFVKDTKDGQKLTRKLG